MPAGRTFVRLGCLTLTVIAGCSDSSAGPSPDKNPASSAPTVKFTLPAEAPRDTTLDVLIAGSGFDRETKVTFERNGAPDPRVRVNSTQFVVPTSLRANVTITADAGTGFSDVAVMTGAGKKGTGAALFTVTVIPNALDGGAAINGVNASGDAVGHGPGAVQCSAGGLPFLWRQDGSRVSLPLGTYCGGTGLAINQSGMILGSLFGSAPPSQVGLWIPSGTGYALVVLPPLPAPDDFTAVVQGGLNDRGEVIGWAQRSVGLYWWSDATGWLPLQLPAGATSCRVSAAINNLGGIAGACAIAGKPADAYYWQNHDATPVLLPRPAGTGDVSVRDINDAGVIVGSGPGGAVKWTPNGSTYTVSSLPAIGVTSVATGIAQDGTVSGTVYRTATDPRPAFWSPTGNLTLLGLLDHSGSGEAMSVAVTSTGLVVGGAQSSQTALRWIGPRWT